MAADHSRNDRVRRDGDEIVNVILAACWAILAITWGTLGICHSWTGAPLDQKTYDAVWFFGSLMMAKFFCEK